MKLPGEDAQQNLSFTGTGFPGVFESPGLELWKGTLVQFERMGFRMPTAAEASRPGWGFSPESTALDDRNQYSSPISSSEIVREFDVQRCVEVQPGELLPTGVTYELAHWRLPSGAVMILEDIPTIFDDVTAYDELGVPYHSYGSINGERLCRNELVHPDPLVTQPLTWQFSLTWTDDPSRNAPSSLPDLTYRGPVLPAEILGQHITPPWRDLRYGNLNAAWSHNKQFIAPSSVVVRYWVTLTGPTNKFRVRVGARIGGFWQLGGRKGSALASVLTRRV